MSTRPKFGVAYVKNLGVWDGVITEWCRRLLTPVEPEPDWLEALTSFRDLQMTSLYAIVKFVGLVLSGMLNFPNHMSFDSGRLD